MDSLRGKIDEILMKHHHAYENLLPILLEVQTMSDGHYISIESGIQIAEGVKIPYSQLSEVFTFFSAINQGKKGKYHIEMCNSTVCRVNDVGVIEKYLKEKLDVEIGGTTSDNLFTLDHAPCFGACDISPSIRINKIAYGHLTVEKTKKILQNLRGE